MVMLRARIGWRIGAVLVGLVMLAESGCKPDLEGRPSLVDSPRVVAIRSTPAEASAGSSVTYDVLVAKPVADTAPHALDWALCLVPKPLASSGSISEECLAPSGPNLTELGNTSSVDAVIPTDSCQRFGPDTPKQSDPPLRPVDPDTTGGFYQPVRLYTEFGSGNAQYEVGVTRLLCRIGGVTQEQAAIFTRDYRANQNPRIERVLATRANSEETIIDLTGATVATVSRGEALAFQVGWPQCPLEASCGDGVCSAGEDLDSCPSDCQNPKGCEGAEPYLSYDTAAQSLVNRRESIRISWYATNGTFDHDRTGLTEAEADQSSTVNAWTAPSDPGVVRVWLVIRDDRRGVNWSSFDLKVE